MRTMRNNYWGNLYNDKLYELINYKICNMEFKYFCFI